MRSYHRALIARATLAHLAYTTVFERINEVSDDATAVYGAITSVQGASGPVTIHLLNQTTPAVSAKMCWDCAVVNGDGAHTVTILAPDGKTVNGEASIVLPASPGAFAWCFIDTTSGNWVAFVDLAGGAFNVPPTYTAKGPGSAPFSIGGSATAVPQTSITTAAFSASQKAIITYSVQIDTTAGTNDIITLGIFDGVAGSNIDTFEATCGNSAVDVNPWHDVISWTLEEQGNGSPRTFGLGVSDATPGNCTIPINGCRGVVQIVDG